MSTPLFSEEDRRRLHDNIDVALNLDGIKGIMFSLSVFCDNGVSVASVGKGQVCEEDFIRTGLRILADQCRDMGTPNALAMLPLIAMCIDCIERLYTKSHDKDVFGIVITEKRQ